MSDTFDAFLRQYHADAQEKADGYDPGHFSGLSPSELENAVALLAQAARQGDVTAIQGLGLSGASSAIGILEALLPGFPAGTELHLETVFALWKLTRSEVYQRQIVMDTGSDNETVRRFALKLLSDTIPTEVTLRCFEEILISHPDEGMRWSATLGLLWQYGLLSGPLDFGQRHLDLRRKLLAPGTRDQALQELRTKGSRNG